MVSILLHSQTQVHIFHLQTKSYSEHKALQGYYEGIDALVDGIIESYQGKYDVVNGYNSIKTEEYKSSEQVIKYFKALDSMVEKNRKSVKESYIQNSTGESNKLDYMSSNFNNTLNINIGGLNEKINIVPFDSDWDLSKLDINLKKSLLLSTIKYTQTMDEIFKNERNLNIFIKDERDAGIVYKNETEKLKEISINEIVDTSMKKLHKYLKQFYEDIKNVELDDKSISLSSSESVSYKLMAQPIKPLNLKGYYKKIYRYMDYLSEVIFNVKFWFFKFSF